MDAGEALFRQGDEAHDWFVVLNGRLRCVVVQATGMKAVREVVVCDVDDTMAD